MSHDVPDLPRMHLRELTQRRPTFDYEPPVIRNINQEIEKQLTVTATGSSRG
jgi:hypothetical protein